MSDKSFIEVQFPVSKISKESYKERKANLGQTLTGLGKWWGRKPLILVRATILGLLLPATNDPVKDREVFFKLLTMDDEGLYKRKVKSISTKDIYNFLDDKEKQEYFSLDAKGSPRYIKGITKNQKDELQKMYFETLSYDEKLALCCRPEEVDNVISKKEWEDINEHLGTNASSLQELMDELGKKKFGHTPVVGDCFAGGGSIPFEAARIGCEAYASDLNPIACLLNWANLNILSQSNEDIEKLREFQQNVYNEVDKKLRDLETNENGDRAVTYLYCNETKCPECGYTVPLSPTWIIGKGTNTIAVLKDNGKNGFDIEIKSNATQEELKSVEDNSTIKGSKFICANCKNEASISAIRKDRVVDGKSVQGLKRWSSGKFINDNEDVFHERLYCIKYIQTYTDEKGNKKERRYYEEPSLKAKASEEIIEKILQEKIQEFIDKGIIPNNSIEEGYNTSQLIRERGWTYWYQLFNPRQLLTNAYFIESINNISNSKEEYVVGLLGLNKCVDLNSKLCRWINGSGVETTTQTFYNQALNSLYNYGTRSIEGLKIPWFCEIKNRNNKSKHKVSISDARNIESNCDMWITDPPYADAVNYHELSEYFLAWDKNIIENNFKDWYTDSKRVLAVKGTGQEFNQSMIEVYSNLSRNMPDNGMQVVMFTHQDVKVWAELALVLWASGLQVTSAWNIATETESGGLKDGGNYVKGTVILVLKKRISNEKVFLDELYEEIEDEVKAQIDSMRDLDDKEDPNFTDADYLLAAYAASLKVLTSYKNIEDIDVQYELSKSDANSPIVNIINEAVKIAFDYLTPSGFDTFTWKTLLPEERFYIKGLDTEKEGVYKISAYQELGRGFGVKEYSDMMASSKANQARLKTASEFAMKYTNESSKFGQSVLRNVLIALYKSSKEEDATKGKVWLRNEVEGYWNERSKIVEILEYISTLEHIENMKHWEKDAKSAKILVELVRHDGV